MQKLVSERLKRQQKYEGLQGPYSYKISDVHTGRWRKKRPVVQASVCIGCSICKNICPCGVIETENKLAIIDYTYCKGCGICAEECPKVAIFMDDEANYEGGNHYGSD